MFERAELATVDARFAVREDPAKAKDVVIVGVDAQTLSDLNARPPIRRLYHARLLDRLREYKPRAIAYDFQFTERSDRPADDERLAQAVLDITPTVPVVMATRRRPSRRQDADLRRQRPELGASPATRA